MTKRWSFRPVLGMLGASLIGNLLPGNRVIRAGEGAIATIERQGTTRADKDF